MHCIVDCRVDNDLSNNYLELSLWGKTCYSYVLEAVNDAGCFSEISVVTNSPKVRNYCKNHYSFVNTYVDKIKQHLEPVFIISGRVPCVSSTTIRSVAESFDGKDVVSAKLESVYDFFSDKISFYSYSAPVAINAFIVSDNISDKENDESKYYILPESEAVTINSINDFELALVLKKKQINRLILEQSIDDSITKKEYILRKSRDEKSICFVGHSQLDQWEIANLGGYKVRNCGISGISSFEYFKKIIFAGKLNCQSDVFIVMHGTNDIVYEYTNEEISESILDNVMYIKEKNTAAIIIFLSCVHVNGRLDRSNVRIDELNYTLKDKLKGVIWVDTDFLDNEYGELSNSYTLDGLHLNEDGYSVLKRNIEETLKVHGLWIK